MNQIKEHSHYPYNVVNKYDKHIQSILSLDTNKSQEVIGNMSDKEIATILNFADTSYKDKLVKKIFDVKKDSISDYLIVYLLENAYDMNQMIQYFAQSIDKSRLNELIKKTRLKINQVNESDLRDKIRKIIYAII